MKKYLSLLRRTYLLKDSNIFKIISNINKFKNDVDVILLKYGFLKKAEPYVKTDSYEILENIFMKFHRVANQLKKRYEDRSTLKIEDEYDVQDLLHALLLEHFIDVRPEEYTPSYAGSSTRTDFLLKREKIFIEVKKTRKNMTDKSLGNELIIDRDHYRKHPDCNALFCLIYDPDEALKNPEALENDLSGFIEGYETKVYVVPKRWSS